MKRVKLIEEFEIPWGSFSKSPFRREQNDDIIEWTNLHYYDWQSLSESEINELEHMYHSYKREVKLKRILNV